MQSLTADNAKRKFDDLLMTVQREPTQISKNGSPVAVIMSFEEYEQLEQLKMIKLRFEQAERDIGDGKLADGDKFMKLLNQGQID